jgi:hypothetical protein
MLKFAGNKDWYGGGFSETLTWVLGIAGTQFEIKIKPPRQAQEWSYSSHRESIGKALSSPGIKSNKKTNINCGSSARMAGNVCANVDQIRRQGRWNNTTINSDISPTFRENWCDQWQASKSFWHRRIAPLSFILMAVVLNQSLQVLCTPS